MSPSDLEAGTTSWPEPEEAGGGRAEAEESASDLPSLLQAYERSVILAALDAVGGRQRSAAALLRIRPSTLHEKMKRLGIPTHRARRAAVPAGDEACASFQWKGRLPAGGTLEIRGLNGPVRIEAADGDRIEVRANRRGQRALAAPVEVKLVEHGRGVTVCAVCQAPSAPRRLGAPLSRAVSGVNVDFLARVPPGIRVVASTVNGDIEVVGLAGNVEADAANGHVRFLPAPARSPLSPVPNDN